MIIEIIFSTGKASPRHAFFKCDWRSKNFVTRSMFPQRSIFLKKYLLNRDQEITITSPFDNGCVGERRINSYSLFYFCLHFFMRSLVDPLQGSVNFCISLFSYYFFIDLRCPKTVIFCCHCPYLLTIFTFILENLVTLKLKGS